MSPLHDPSQWHPYNGDHHHGYDPKGFISIFGEPLATYLAEFGEISFPWRTSAVEEHEGYTWLFTSMRPGETIFNNGGKLPVDSLHYIRHALLQVHTTGDMHHLRKQFHSHYGFFLQENRYTGQQGVVATGGWVDYGSLHAPYKKKLCLETPPGHIDLNQPPYRSTQTRFTGKEMVEFWSGLWLNQKVKALFPADPQHILGLAWSTLDAKEYPDESHCMEEAFDKDAFEDGNRRFQLFTIALRNLPIGPFAGYTDRWGHIIAPTGTLGVDEVPLVVTSGVPVGEAMLNRPVLHGNETAAPIMQF